VLHTSLCPSSGYLTNPLPEGEPVVESNLVKNFEDLFIEVKNWRGFDSSDIARNWIQICSEEMIQVPVPKFVEERERELNGERGLNPDVCCFL
jgi:hypothetical protein